MPVKYDLYAAQIVATDRNGQEILLDTKYYKVILLTIDGQETSFKKVNPKRPNQFYEVLYESGDVIFFKDRQARLKKGQNLGITNQPSRFSQHNRYYISGADRGLVKVNLKKRDVFNHFPEVEAVVMREYIKKSKIKLSKEKDYKKLFAALDDD